MSALDQSRSEPDFNQEVRINVNGIVGDKLNILADWNTQRTFEYENQLKIKYTGYEDEIVQSVEAGNVSLQTPSLVGGGQALFGIKAKLQTGPLTLTTLLSQKKGQTKELVVSGGAQQSSLEIFPHQYSKSYYFVDTLYEAFYDILNRSQIPNISQNPQIQQKQIIKIDLWVSQSGYRIDPSQRQANAYIDLPPRLASASYPSDVESTLSKRTGDLEQGRFIKIDPAQYKVNQFGGYVVLNTNVTDDQALAVSYTVVGNDFIGGTADDEIFGATSEADTTVDGKLILKLVKPRYLQPSYKRAWKMLLKNVYPIGGRDLKKEGFELHILRRTNGPEQDAILGEYLLRVLGLDRFDQNNSEAPDNVFDFIPGLTVNIERAEIIFPTLRPFDEGIRRYFQNLNPPINVPDSLLFGDIYDTTQTAAANNITNNKYFLRVKSSTAQSSRYNLGFNIVEGSVQVLLNGSPLQPNIDYTVDYIIGEVIIRNPQALLPGANVQVKYEQNDLFQLASKTLIGARGEMPNLLPNTNLGFTMMSLNQATLSDKVRLGEEPTQNLILGADASTNINASFITDVLDALPLLKTKELSTIRFGGEAAYVLPDPNTKKSTVQSDGGASLAYLDDFEGARRTIPLPINFSGWKLASAPQHSILGGESVDDSTKVYSKAKISWYNRLPSDVASKEIWPYKDVRRGQELITVLNIDYDPDRRGVYNFSPNLPQDLHSNPGKNWAGTMRYISSTAGNLIDQNIGYLELWIKASSSDEDDLRRGRLYIDLGRISEDVIPTLNPRGKQLHSEDLVVNDLPNGVLNPGEDVGLDMLTDVEERSDPRIQSFLNSPANAGDLDVDPNEPSGDNWLFSVGGKNFDKINGTENNGNGPDGRLPDTEDLNNDGDVNTVNQYLGYEIPLDTLYYDSSSTLVNNHLKVGGGINGWYQLRIPLIDEAKVFPVSSTQSKQSILQNVQYARMWLTGFKKPVSIRIAEISLVGNQWQELARDDDTMKVAVVNIEDNPEYRTPPGVIRERDRTQPDQIIEGNEQSLALVLNSLARGSSRQAVKYFTARPLDLFNYNSMKMFVHGDPSFQYIDTSQFDAEIFLRFGNDTTNYYEYRQPIHPGWYRQNNEINEINIIFSDLTAVKSRADSLNQFILQPVPNGPPGAMYGARGNPSLRQVRYIGIGVRHVEKSTKPYLSGQVWVNELRLVDVENAPGLAYRFDTQIKLADIGAVGFNYSRTDPNFHGLDQRFGSRNTGVNWALNTNFELGRFFPQEWQGTSIPIGYSHSENLLKPKYQPNTDIVVEKAAEGKDQRLADSIITESQSLRVQDSYSINVKIVPPVQAWYVRETISKLSFGVNYSKSSDRDPSFLNRSNWSWQFRANYGVNIPSDYYIQPFKKIFSGIFILDEVKDWKFYYIPFTNVSAGLSAQRSRNYEVARAQLGTPRETRSLSSGKSFGFGWKFTEGGLTNLSGDYGLSSDRNLSFLDNDTVGRGFSSVLNTILFRGSDNNYRQQVSVNTRPKIPNIFDIPKYLDLTGGYRVGYGWQNAFQQGDIGKSAGFDNSISVSMNFKLKALTDPWFDTKDELSQRKPQEGKESEKPGADTSKKNQTEGEGSKSIFSQLKTLAKVFLKTPFLNFENINISYSQTNRVTNSGVIGKTGFQNFWGRLPFQGSIPEYGPSRLYQLGIITDPSGTLHYRPKSSFPFVGWETESGLRAPNASLTNQFSQKNDIALRTNRPLWEGASIDINWKIGWQFNKTSTISTDSIGVPTVRTVTTSGSIERSFFTLPPFLLFKVFRSNLEDVGKKYDARIESGEQVNNALAESFEQGLEALPFFSKFFGQFVPRPNWTLRWDGVERITGLSSIIDRMSLEHSYASTFKRDFRGLPDGTEQTDVERATFGFSPLVAVNTTFKNVLNGGLSGNLRFNTTTTYDLNLTSRNIVETFSQEMSLSMTYSRRGFQIPFFGLNLSNDVDVTFTFSRTKNSRRAHDPRYLTINQEGTPLEGNTRTTLEPRIRYVLSSRVSAALFYRYTRVAPDEGGSLIFGTTTNEAGLDIHISI
ncbi:MAG TPA: cell surface protein SprA [Bacteroidota bacterium]|nr:cell surface protein SprA [Bacteroidota bacterium]